MTSRPPAPLRSLGVPLLFCGLGLLGIMLGFVLFLDRTGRIDWLAGENRWEGQQRTDYRHIPPEWIAYQQTDVLKCPVPGQPTCFAVQNDSTFIIGTASPPAMSFFDGNGTLLRNVDLPDAPRAIVCGTAKTILSDKIVVAHPHHIAIYTAEGDRENTWRYPDEKSNVRSLVLTPDYLFAADTGKRTICRWDADGNPDLTFGEGFVVYAAPITMTYSPQTDLLYAANPGKHQVEVFTQDGIAQPEWNWGESSTSLSGFAGCCNPIGLAVLDDGRILTVEKGIYRVKIFKAAGQLDSVVAGPGTLESIPPETGRTPPKPIQRYFSAAVLSEGRVAVFDYEYAVIHLFALNIPPSISGSASLVFPSPP